MPRNDDPDSIAKRIRQFRKSAQGCSTQKVFAIELGIDQQRLSGYENRTSVPHHVVAAMIRMGANPYWLIFGEGTMRGTPEIEEGAREREIKAINLTGASVSDDQLAEFRVFPLYADEAAAEQPCDTRTTEIEGPAIIHRSWCPHPQETDYVRVASTGTSMEPTIPAGAIVTIDRTECDPERLVGKIVAVGLREGGVTLKRLQKDGRGGFVGVPENKNANHTVVPIRNGDRVIGVVQTVQARIG